MDILKNILSDIKVEFTEEFDRNFEREAFFSKPWKSSPHGLKLSGNLRKSIQSKISGNSVVFTSQLPYAGVHNEGLRAGRGKGFIMPKRQFIGDSPEVHKTIENIIHENMDEHFKDLTIEIQRHLNTK